MAITIKLPNPINTSLQAKPISIAVDEHVETGGWDVIYFTRIDQDTKRQKGNVIRLGFCIGVVPGSTHYTVSVEPDNEAQTPNDGDFIFFGKDNRIGMASVKGYHAVVEMKNDSRERAELYCVASEIGLSSK